MTVKTVGYTGWKIVGAAALGGASLNALKTRILIVFIVAFVVFILAVINAYISTRITTPIEKLERSVNGIEAIWKRKSMWAVPMRSVTSAPPSGT